MNEIVYCCNEDCTHQGYKQEVCNTDKTNCRIHDGEELLRGECSDFLRSDNSGYRQALRDIKTSDSRKHCTQSQN